MKKFLTIAAVVIVFGVIVSWLWPEPAPAPLAPPPPAAQPKPVKQEAPKPAEHEEPQAMEVTFINHLGNVHINFNVDGVHICTANAGKSCIGKVTFGTHTVDALEGKEIVRTMSLTVAKDIANPKVIVCMPGAPDC